MIISLIIGLALGAVAVTFIFQNMGVATVSFLTWELEGSLALILILTLVAGAVITLLFFWPRSLKKDFRIMSLEKQVKSLKEKLDSKDVEIEEEKSKLDTNNAYLDDLEKKS